LDQKSSTCIKFDQVIKRCDRCYDDTLLTSKELKYNLYGME
jgi:hypothetical protein